MKTKRIVDHALLSTYRGDKCLACTSKQTEAHHIKSKGSGGDDVEHNLMPLCRKHHTEIHQIGLSSFTLKHCKVRTYLEQLGWEFNQQRRRWVRYEYKSSDG